MLFSSYFPGDLHYWKSVSTVADSRKRITRSRILLQNVRLNELCSVQSKEKRITRLSKDDKTSETLNTTDSEESEARSDSALSLSTGSTDEGLLTTLVATKRTMALQFSNQQFDLWVPFGRTPGL